ncbi:MAG: hypothetical protein JXR70_17415 [Spirochaetales bacterium]|nr:hypothetical protein [Spirochaetales bacterium]
MIAESLYILLHVIVGSLLTFTLFYVVHNRNELRPGYTLLLLISVWVWILSIIGEYSFPLYWQKIFFTYLKYVGVLFLPIGWYLYGRQLYRRSKNFIFYRNFFSIIAVILLILIFTNPLHHLFWEKAYYSANGISIDEEYKKTFLLIIIICSFFVFMGFINILQAVIHKKISSRGGEGSLLFAALFPVIVAIAEAILGRHNRGYSLLAISFALSSLLVVYILRIRYYRSIPFSQKMVIESLSDMVFILSPESKLIYLNPSAQAALKMDIFNDTRRLTEIYLSLHRVFKNENPPLWGSKDITILDQYYDVNISPLYGSQGRLISKIIVFRNVTHLKGVERDLRKLTEELEQRVQERTGELENAITALRAENEERRKAEEKIRLALNEKTILVGEIHHRVKNNLQIISSLLSLQQRTLGDKDIHDVFRTAISRIKSIAMIHEKLYKSDDLANTNFSDYVSDLSNFILNSHTGAKERIHCDLEIQDLNIDLDRAILCGLVINELMINAIKYAFPEDFGKKAKKIGISFIKVEDNYILKVYDNGLGIPEEKILAESESLGMKIVQTLVKQLKGEFKLRSDQGTVIEIAFPVTRKNLN